MAALLDMYAKCGAIDEARQIFDQLVERDCVSWTSMITAYGSHGKTAEALEIFSKMEGSKAKPDKVTFLAVISACSHGGTPTIKSDVGLLSTLFSACTMHGDIHLGEEIARQLIEKDPDDPSTYIVVSNMYASLGKWREARQIKYLAEVALHQIVSTTATANIGYGSNSTRNVYDATSNEPWGSHGSDLAEIAQATKKFTDCKIIMNVLWTRLADSGCNWRHVYKTTRLWLLGNIWWHMDLKFQFMTS
ncbi:hypothetical protein MKW98_021457 [Papaver atlanticum]|uniref:ENTH domain-containing protein n=1 Tax=Papaver atlanticum TaxID=357466 RepID=A0AAD4SRG1_9MAGN|nr:hypothetical protein MKW98_021457 [Papaver atlanticum]